MNILQIGTTDKRGGAALVSWSIKEKMDELGIQNSMFVADKLSSDEKIKKINRSSIRKNISILFGKDFYNTDWILKTPEFHQADLVHFHNIHGRYFNLKTFEKICKYKPVIWTLHDEWAITDHAVYTLESNNIIDGMYESPSDEMPERIIFYNKNILRKFKKNTLLKSNFTIATPSIWLKNRVQQSYLKNKKVELIYNGINLKKFKPIDKIEARKKLNLPLDKKIIFSISDGGANSPIWKGWNYTKNIIDHYKNDKNIIFFSVGNERKEKVKQNNVIYAGLINNDDLNYYFSACDFLLNTSIADNFPLTILEAMACGLPIISFDVGGIKEAVVDGQTGFIAKYKDNKDLIRQIDALLKLESEDYQRISENNLLRTKNQFSKDLMTENYINLYKKIISENNDKKDNKK